MAENSPVRPLPVAVISSSVLIDVSGDARVQRLRRVAIVVPAVRGIAIRPVGELGIDLNGAITGVVDFRLDLRLDFRLGFGYWIRHSVVYQLKAR